MPSSKTLHLRHWIWKLQLLLRDSSPWAGRCLQALMENYQDTQCFTRNLGQIGRLLSMNCRYIVVPELKSFVFVYHLDYILNFFQGKSSKLDSGYPGRSKHSKPSTRCKIRSQSCCVQWKWRWWFICSLNGKTLRHYNLSLFLMGEIFPFRLNVSIITL